MSNNRRNRRPLKENPNFDTTGLPVNNEDPTTQPGFVHEDDEKDELDFSDSPEAETASKFNGDFSGANDDEDDSNMDAPVEPETPEEEPEVPEVIDFRKTEDGLMFTPDTEEYKALSALQDSEDGAWDDYIQLMSDAGVNVVCDDLTDAYKVTWSDSDEDLDSSEDDMTDLSDNDDDEATEDVNEYVMENKAKVGKRFPVSESSIKAIKQIVEGKGYTFLTLRGSLLESKQSDLYELIVEKNGNRTSVVYNDNTTFKPWNWNKGSFQHLQECLDAIYIPFKTLVNETAQKDIDKKVRTQRVEDDKLNEWAYKTTELPLEEQKRREKRGSEIFDKIVGKSELNRGFDFGRD